MKTVITYGTFDLLHYGHIRLLERAKKLGDYLIVGVTSDDYDKTRGKINVKESLEERIESIKATGLADKIIVEEYEGQKIDDIKRYNVDIFAIGSDWIGEFDYLKEYCEVIYLKRTEGISSTKLRSEKRNIKLGLVGNSVDYLTKFQNEDVYVNGIEIIGICTDNINSINDQLKNLPIITNSYDELLKKVDAVYLYLDDMDNFEYAKKALINKKHVLCESPLALKEKEAKELFSIAKENNCYIVDAIRTAYSMAYSRLLLLLKSGKIGNILDICVTCTSMKKTIRNQSLLDWGANCLLPVFQILGTDYKEKRFIVKYLNKDQSIDLFTKIDLLYENASATIKVAKGAKSEGSMVITGTKGYIYVPAPWWKTHYFEIRYENSEENKRYFYQLDGEGIRYELVFFAKLIENNNSNNNYINQDVSLAICKVMEDFLNKKNVVSI